MLRRSTCCGAERALCEVGDGIATRPFSACKLIDPKPGACTTRRSREANHRSCQSSAWALAARRRAVHGIGLRRALSRRGTNLQGKAGDRGCAPAPSGTGPNDFAIRHTCGFTTALKSSSEGFHLLWWQPAKCAGGDVVCRSSPCCFFRFPRVCFLMGDVVRNSRENSWDRPCLAYTHPRRLLFAASSLEPLPNHSLGVDGAHPICLWWNCASPSDTRPTEMNGPRSGLRGTRAQLQ